MLDVIELKKGYFPKIKSRLLTKKEDINSVTYDSATNKIFLGLHVNPDEYNLDTDSGFHGAYLRTVELDKNNKVKVVKKNIVTQERALHSWAANDAAILGSEVLVPVGAIEGGVEVLPSGDINSDENFISGINDTRAVDTYS